MEQIPKNVAEAIDILLDAGVGAQATATYAEAMEDEGTLDTFLERVRHRTPPYSEAYLMKIIAQVHRKL